MFTLSESHKFYYYTGVTDMRKSFNGLSGIIQSDIGDFESENTIYIFVNKRRDKIKILRWQSDGYLLYYKRLEEGSFKFPKYDIEKGLVKISYTELIMLVDGISIINLNKGKRFSVRKDDK